MTRLARVGVDTSKSVFQLHGVDQSETVLLRHRLRRAQFLAYFAKLEPTVVGLEACGASHYWARELCKLGHTVMLITPKDVKAYVRRNKNDTVDAEAICEAMSRPRVRERQVPVKSVEQSAAQMLMGVRESLIQRRTQVINSLRGHATEFGLTAAKGPSKISDLLARIAQAAEVPAPAKELFVLLGRELDHVGRQIAEVEKKMMSFHRGNELTKRLAEVPTIGPVGACMLAIKVVNPHGFRSGRMCSAWAGLTPKDHSTAGKQRLGGITRAGDEGLRSVLVNGATAYIQQVRRGRIKASPWLSELLKRKPPKLAAVALANKTVRIAWKLMVSGERYDPGHEQRRRAQEAAGPTAAGLGFAGMQAASMMPAEASHAAR